MPGRVYGYARVSSEEQARGTSLRDQQDSISRYATSIGRSVDRFFVEAVSGARAKESDRAQMQELLRTVRRGDLVIVDKLDRWSRDAEFILRSVREISEAGCKFFAVADNCDPDRSDGKFMLTIFAAVAEKDRQRIRERMVGTRKILRDEGYYVEGLPPYGYRRGAPSGKKDPAKNILVVEPAEAEVVRAIYAASIAGDGIELLAERHHLKRDRVHEILNCRVYTGEAKNSKGEWIRGRHPAILDASTYLRAREACMARKHGSRRIGLETHTAGWILRDVARCAFCGSKMSSAWAGPKDRRRFYYRCLKPCAQSSYVRIEGPEAEADRLVLEHLRSRRDELAREPTKVAKPKTTSIESKVTALQAKRDRYLEMYSEGDLTKDAMRAKVAAVDEQVLRLRAEAELVKPPPSPDVRRAMLAEVTTLEKAWSRSPGPRKRAIVNQLVLAAKVSAGREPSLEWRR